MKRYFMIIYSEKFYFTLDGTRKRLGILQLSKSTPGTPPKPKLRKISIGSGILESRSESKLELDCTEASLLSLEARFARSCGSTDTEF